MSSVLEGDNMGCIRKEWRLNLRVTTELGREFGSTLRNCGRDGVQLTHQHLSSSQAHASLALDYHHHGRREEASL